MHKRQSGGPKSSSCHWVGFVGCDRKLRELDPSFGDPLVDLQLKAIEQISPTVQQGSYREYGVEAREDLAAILRRRPPNRA